MRGEGRLQAERVNRGLPQLEALEQFIMPTVVHTRILHAKAMQGHETMESEMYVQLGISLYEARIVVQEQGFSSLGWL